MRITDILSSIDAEIERVSAVRAVVAGLMATPPRPENRQKRVVSDETRARMVAGRKRAKAQRILAPYLKAKRG